MTPEQQATYYAQLALLERREAAGIKDASMPRNERERRLFLTLGSVAMLEHRAREAARERQEAQEWTTTPLYKIHDKPSQQSAPERPKTFSERLLDEWVNGRSWSDILEELEEERAAGSTNLTGFTLHYLAGARGIDTAALDARDEETHKRRRFVRVYPALWAQARQNGLDNALRVYWLAYHLEPSKGGKLTIAQLREALTGKDSELRAFGWRRLRQILREGEGVLWTRRDDAAGELCLWRHSPARVLLALGGERLRGRPVAVDARDIAAGKHAYSSAMLSAWHAGRRSNDAPISQGSVRQATAVAESTQRTYQKTAQIQTTRNIALTGKQYTPDAHRAALFEMGAGVFVMRKRSKSGAYYTQLAYALPNSYTSKLETLPRGRTRKINRHLVTNAERGKDGQIQRVYFDKASSAAAAASKERRITYAQLSETTNINARRKPLLERAQQWREYSVLA